MLAQQVAKDGVNETFLRPALKGSTSLYRLIDHRVLVVAARLQRINRAPEQSFDERLRPAAMGQRADDALHAPVAAQCAVREIDECGARCAGQMLRLVCETRARRHARDDARGVGELRREALALRRHCSRVPLGNRRPRMKSAALMRRPPAAWISSIASASAPQATTRASSWATMVPGCPAPATTRARQTFKASSPKQAAAPGVGRNARTVRSSSGAGRSQCSRTSVFAILCAYVIPSL